MNILDENVPADQRKLLKTWRIRTKQIGQDIGRQGMKDENEIIPLLQALPRLVLFTRDLGFYRRRFRHSKYGIVCLAVPAAEAASYIHRFLHHPAFALKARRIGRVARLSERGISWWQLGAQKEAEAGWAE